MSGISDTHEKASFVLRRFGFDCVLARFGRGGRGNPLYKLGAGAQFGASAAIADETTK